MADVAEEVISEAQAAIAAAGELVLEAQRDLIAARRVLHRTDADIAAFEAVDAAEHALSVALLVQATAVDSANKLGPTALRDTSAARVYLDHTAATVGPQPHGLRPQPLGRPGR